MPPRGSYGLATWQSRLSYFEEAPMVKPLALVSCGLFGLLLVVCMVWVIIGMWGFFFGEDTGILPEAYYEGEGTTGPYDEDELGSCVAFVDLVSDLRNSGQSDRAITYLINDDVVAENGLDWTYNQCRERYNIDPVSRPAVKQAEPKAPKKKPSVSTNSGFGGFSVDRNREGVR